LTSLPNERRQWTHKSSIQLIVIALWRHTVARTGSGQRGFPPPQPDPAGGLGMRVRGIWVCCVVVVACATSPPVEAPPCSDFANIPRPSAGCATGSDFTDYQNRLAEAFLSRLRWTHPDDLPVFVALDSESQPNSICAGGAVFPTWSVRNRIARSLPELRAAGPAPVCAAGSKIDLLPALLRQSKIRRRPRISDTYLASCASLHDVICTNQMEPVCAVYPAGERRTYSNACEACRDLFVKGYRSGPCQR